MITSTTAGKLAMNIFKSRTKFDTCVDPNIRDAQLLVYLDVRISGSTNLNFLLF